MSADSHRVSLQPTFVLHQRPYRETSRIVELFTRDHGRVSVFARGTRSSRKGYSALGSILQPFNRLLVSWSGRGEAGQLTHAEFDGEFRDMPASQLVSAFYLNELLMKLFVRHDPHPDVFTLYAEALETLKSAANAAAVLRIFEKRLLESIGYGLSLERDALSGEPIAADRAYYYRLEQGPVACAGVAEGSLVLSGAALCALASEQLDDVEVANQLRALTRAALDRVLDGRELKTRQVMLALRRTRAE
ncbi:MAG TPA: DNA repair protein RecO [Steroidobacteraceae bacterium]|nr:DNA repair protein RecO [Steroidobacteraceae bacterium]